MQEEVTEKVQKNESLDGGWGTSPWAEGACAQSQRVLEDHEMQQPMDVAQASFRKRKELCVNGQVEIWTVMALLDHCKVFGLCSWGHMASQYMLFGFKMLDFVL